jgi:3-carboxy-cis,cis-muconate cycloisomerase
MSDVFAHPWLSGLFADDRAAEIWSAERQLSHMIAFEAAWSRHGHLAELWTREEGGAAAQHIENAQISPEDLRGATGRDGVCVPELVRRLKTIAGNDAVHLGATSQDVIDTATVCSLVATFDLLDARLEALHDDLQSLSDRFGRNPLMGRTRMQAAVPMHVSDRLFSWMQPLGAHRERLKEIRSRIAEVQIGGAVGNRARLGGDVDAFCAAVAADLGLRPSSHSWHARRDGIVEAASIMSLITGSLGKMGQDICLMTQQGIEELTLEGGGGSSAMPHKQNPVLAELLVTLARYNAVQVSGMHQALVHEQERSGAAWSLEWMILPSIAQAAARALSVGGLVVSQITGMGTN